MIVDWFIKEQVKIEGEGEQRKISSTVGLRASTSTKYSECAYRQIKETLTKKHAGRIKENWDLYDKYGYYPFDKIKGESVSDWKIRHCDLMKGGELVFEMMGSSPRR